MLIVASYAQMTSYKSISSSGVIKRLPWLRVEGQWIVDENGNRIQLRGAGCDYTAYEKYDILESYFALLSSKGCNLVRLGFNVPGHRIGGGTVYDPAKMDRTLALCKKYGLYAVLDCHHYSEWVNWFSDLKNFWVNVATRYANESAIAWYELMNEPYAVPPSEFRSYMKELTDAIRAVGDNHIIAYAEYAKWTYEWLEGDIWPEARRFWNVSQVFEPNSIYSVHHWPGALTRGAATDLPTYYCEASEYVYFLRFLRDQLQKPVWAGEFGSYNYTAPNWDLDHVIEIMRLCEDAGIPWCIWMMEKNYPWNYLIPEPYTSNIVPSDVPRAFSPKPFDMINKTIGYNLRQVGYNRWGSSFYELQSGAYVTFQGPIKVKIVRWDDFYGSIVHDEQVIEIIDQGNITRDWSQYTRIFAYEDLAP